MSVRAATARPSTAGACPSRRGRAPGRRAGTDHGTALLTVLGAILLLSAIGLSLVLMSMSETMATGNLRRAHAALYAAEAGLERASSDLLAIDDWNAVLAGSVRSAFADGAPGGVRMLDGGRSLDLDRIVNLANCNRAGPCAPSTMDAVTIERPWGRNNPRWRLFAYGPLASLAPAGTTDATGTPYVVVLVADDPAETDDDPFRDGDDASNPGAGVLLLRAEAYGLDSATRVIEAIVARGVHVSRPHGYAAQRGPSPTADDAATVPVQSPGGALSQSEVLLEGGSVRHP